MSEERGQKTLLEVAIRNVGFLKASGVLSFALEWVDAGCHEVEGLRRQVERFVSYWGVSDRQVWRRLRTFRAAFPMFATPDDLLALGVERREGKRSEGDVLALGLVVLP